MKVALLISTYNWPSALNLILLSLQNQKEKPEEILIADDGSTKETRELIEKFKGTTELPVKHFWHEDKGFRKSAILNKAIAGTDADYIIQIDGDCIPEKNFIKDHKAYLEKDVFLFGSRVNIREKSVPRIMEKEVFKFSFFSRDIIKRTRNLNIPLLRNFYKKKPGFSKKVRGCNLSFWRKDFLEINGYNEDIEGWGREDSEMVIRLLNKGVLGKRLRYGGIVYHIYHVEKSKDRLLENELIQRETIDTRKISCFNGINKYL